jgi:hypothetical protein
MRQSLLVRPRSGTRGLAALGRRVVADGLMFRDLADDFAGEPGEVLCGAARIAVTRQLR